MRLMIDVNEEDYKALHECVTILNGRRNGKTLESRIFAAVGNGVPFPKGHWIEPPCVARTPFARQWKCSNCGEQAFKTDFCPHCGADMRKEESALKKRAEMEMIESCYLEQGITQGIV